MAVTEEFKQAWLECQDEYGKNIEQGDIPVMSEASEVDMTVTLPAVKFKAPFNPQGVNVFDEYRHVPLKIFFDKLDVFVGDAEERVSTAVGDAEDAAADARQAAGSVNQAIASANQAASNANEKATLAANAASRCDSSRQSIEANENLRQQNENTRQTQETARERQAAADHTQATTDHTTAGSDHTRAGTDHSTASTDHTRAEGDHTTATQDHTTATSDHEASVAATTAATNVNADLEGMTVTITDRQGVSKSVNIGFEILQEHVYESVAAMNADAANVRAGQFCMIAASDPTSTENAQLWSRNSSAATSEHPFTFLSDLDQASSAAFADWLDNYKPVIEADHTRAETDHSTASDDHTQAGQDHTRAEGDHSTAAQDHTTAGTDHQTATDDHSTAAQDHTRAENDHTTADADHTQAGQDHTRAEGDHSTASTDHTQAGNDHTRAEGDHTTADADHTTAGADHTQAGQDHTRAEGDHTASQTATESATAEANRAKAFNDNPWEIGDDGYIYVWDEDHDNGDGTYGAMVRTNKMIIDFDDLTPEQQAAMVQEFLSHLVFDETPTPGSTNPVTSRGIKTALDQKQDTLVYATVAESEAAAGELT